MNAVINIVKWLVKRLLLTLLLAPLITIPISYFAVQTHFGSALLARHLSHSAGYPITFERIEHRFNNPLWITLVNVNLQNRHLQLNADRLTLIVNPRFWLEDTSLLNALLFEGGYITQAGKPISAFPLSSQQLLLRNVDIELLINHTPIILQSASGSITPWQPASFMQHNTTFQLSARQFKTALINGSHLLMQGRSRNGSIILDTFGADLPYGAVTGQLQRQPSGRWHIDKLLVNRFHWQSSEQLPELYQRLNHLPPIEIKQIEITAANIEGDHWALNNANLSLADVNLQQGKLIGQGKGHISFSADSVVFHQQQYDNPIIKLTLDDDYLHILQANTRWQKGLLQTGGYWHNKTLALNELTISGVEYTLPENWQTVFNVTFPEWLTTLDIASLNTARNVIVDINPDFPAQFTWLDVSGDDLRLIDQHHFSLWRGALAIHANDATLNGVDLRYPTVHITGNEQQLQVEKFSAFIDNGLIDGQLTLNQNTLHTASLTLSGQNIPLNILTPWKIPEIPLQGTGNIQLQLERETDALPLSGRLIAVNQRGEKTELAIGGL